VSVESAALAKSIVHDRSKQTYFTARLLVDRDLEEDFYRGYAYFRWVDDIVDLVARSLDERIAFVNRQRELVDALYRGDRPRHVSPEEQMIVDLVRHDRGEHSGLQSFIRKFLAVLDFDAHRRGRLITGRELDWYSSYLGQSVTDGIQYFIRNGHQYPSASNHYLAATAAHIVHMLRDLVSDVAEGFINIPAEYLDDNSLEPDDFESAPFRDWVQQRVELARSYFLEGKRYLDGLNVLRCKMAGHWYCTRFEVVLSAIEREGYVLRRDYDERRGLSTWLRIARQALSIPLRHAARRPSGRL
jgi:phytoene/squalene synthetase